MLNGRKLPDMLFGALFGIVIFCLGFSVALSLYPPEKNQTAQNTEQRGNATGGDERIADYTLVQTWLNFFLVISTVGLWVQTRKSGQISERALVSLERPYIFPVNPIFIRTPTELYTDFAVANCGRAPGDIKITSIQFFPDETLPVTPPYALGQMREDLDITCIPIAMASPPEINPKVSLGKFVAPNLQSKYFLGYFVYDGFVGKGHKTWFCYRIPDTGSGVSKPDGGAKYQGYN